MTQHVREALDRSAREAVYRFRHHVQTYVKNKASHVEPQHEMIEGQGDQTARQFYVEEEGKILGAIRVNFIQSGAWPLALLPQAEVRRVETIVRPERLSVTSHLYLHPEVRKRNILAPLFAGVYGACLQRDSLINFWNCAADDAHAYRRLGYRPLQEDNHEAAALVLCVQDVDYLRHIESPLFWLAGKREGDGGETAFLLASCYDSFLRDTQDCLGRRLYELRKQRLSALDEASRLTARCVYA